MTAYQIWLTDPNTGNFLVNLPMALSGPYTRLLNGSGSLSGAVPMDTPGLGSVAILERHEITVLRDAGSGFLPDWNGPITNLSVDVENRVYNITAQEISGLFAKRVLEEDRDYTGSDRYDVIRDLVSYATSKVSTTGDGWSTGPGADLNSAIPRFTVSPASASSGYTLSNGIANGVDRYVIADLFGRVFDADPDNPVDWKMDYRTGSTSTACHRTLTLGNPLGTTVTASITNADVFPVTKDMDRFRSANRVHTVAGSGTVTLQNESDIATNNDILLEAVFGKGDVTDASAVTQFTRSARTDSYPPITTHTFTFATGWGSHAFGFCDVGDLININLSDGSLTSIGYRRVTQIGVLPATPDNPEQFIVDISIPLDTLSAA